MTLWQTKGDNWSLRSRVDSPSLWPAWTLGFVSLEVMLIIEGFVQRSSAHIEILLSVHSKLSLSVSLDNSV